LFRYNASMRILAVDTSSQRGSICVMDGDEVVGEVRVSSSIQHSERLFGSIELIFRFLPFRLDDVDIFVAARGPGSFTGLRVGLAATEGFVAALGKTGAGVSTLEGVAWNAGQCDGLIASVVDARRGEIYGGLYRRLGTELVEERPPVVLKPADWFGSLPQESIVFCGDGAIRYQDLIPPQAGWQLRHVDLYLARAMAEIALSSGRGPLQPLYVRKTDPEIAREQRHESVTSPHS
jgi:tRNA threonylcarbamoyladenosine biosynthesis protein TsaB